MIQIQDSWAIVFVETVVIAAALASAHQVTGGRLWSWLQHSFAVGKGRVRLVIGLLILAGAVMVVGVDTVGPDRVANWVVRILSGFIVLMGIGAFLLLRQQRLERQKRCRSYQKQIDALKGSGDPAAPAAVKNWIMALNRCGVTSVELTCCRLRGADLSRTKLYGARMRGADLRSADLREVGLTGADLRGARLAETDFRGAFLYRANLRDADLSRADLRGADLREADLRGARLDECLLANARLEDAKLAGASFRAARLKNTQVTVGQLLKTQSLTHARLDPSLHAELIAARDPLPHLARRLLRLDGTVPLPQKSTMPISPS
jgi:uncharacterized protein YjbI with pentapeptide repeats